MREIVCRAKRKDTGEWVTGYYVYNYRHDSHMILFNYNACMNAGFRSRREDFDLQDCEVIPETVCQYTGLTNKNGRRYEGDIFQASDGDYIQRYIITWSEDYLEWSAECIGDPDGTLPLSEFRVSEIEVIGNIFDNPELIGE